MWETRTKRRKITARKRIQTKIKATACSVLRDRPRPQATVLPASPGGCLWRTRRTSHSPDVRCVRQESSQTITTTTVCSVQWEGPRTQALARRVVPAKFPTSSRATATCAMLEQNHQATILDAQLAKLGQPLLYRTRVSASSVPQARFHRTIKGDVTTVILASSRDQTGLRARSARQAPPSQPPEHAQHVVCAGRHWC